MYKLSELYSEFIKKPIPTDCGIGCELVNPDMAKLNRKLIQSVSCFSYTLVLSGEQNIFFDGKTAHIEKNDLFIFTPGMMIRSVDISDDFIGLCLMGDETTTYEMPFTRNVIAASYFPFLRRNSNILTLSDCDAGSLKRRMEEIMDYSLRDMIYKTETIHTLYALFILELLNIENKIGKPEESSSHTMDLFMRFLKLLSGNFRCHHDIGFYADALAVTPIYLSRIVKRYSGQTVKNHIDRLLLMEASYLLRNTDVPIAAVADKLSFSNPSTFCKFFIRQKAMSPREFRSSSD